jgi:biotin carboxyl carrier protein
MGLEFGLYMALIGIASVFSSLAIIALACIVLKKLFKGEKNSVPAAQSLEDHTRREEKGEGHQEAGAYRISLDGEEHEVKVEDTSGATKNEEIVVPPDVGRELKVVVDGEMYTVKIGGGITTPSQEIRKAAGVAKEQAVKSEHVVKAPMRGTVIRVLVKVGEKVEKGTVIVVLETMKMENAFESPVSGVIKAVRVSEGDTVNAEDILVEIG